MGPIIYRGRPADANGTPRVQGRLSPGEYVVLYSQYIVIALLVLGALALRLAFGAP